MQTGVTYLVGGAVRDRLLGLAVQDRDWVVVGSTPEALLAQGYTSVGHSFPVFLHPQSHEEYALARIERKQGVGYHGFVCDSSATVTLEEDLSRRDLTINAMAEDNAGNLIDPYGGQADLAQRVLRHVSPAFSEDPLRVLRVARFRAQLGNFNFQLAPTTQQLMIEMSHSEELAQLTPERIWKEIHKAFSCSHPQLFWQTLAEVDALNCIVPVMADFYQDTDRWQLALEQLARFSQLQTSAESRFACWCHSLSTTQLQTLRKQLKAPHSFMDYAQAFALLAADLNTLTAKPAADLWQLLKSLNVQRKPERFAQLLYDLQILFGDHPNLNYLQAAAAELNRIDVNTLIAQGFTKAALGEAIHQQGIALLDKLQITALQNLHKNSGSTSADPTCIN